MSAGAIVLMLLALLAGVAMGLWWGTRPQRTMDGRVAAPHDPHPPAPGEFL